MPNDAEQLWREYREREFVGVLPLISELGFDLEAEQPHTGGERSLMQAVTTAAGKKLVLLGRRRKDAKRVVIKATSDPAGIREIERERRSRSILRRIKFAYHAFLSPEELLFVKEKEYAISIQEFIEQEQAFLARPLEEQFALALKAFKAQEGAHATTYGHTRLIGTTFDTAAAREYVEMFRRFKTGILARIHELGLTELLEQSEILLRKNEEVIEQYSGFLTHTDFVPHNFRVVGNNIYLLDHSSLRFGNKYEGWARFLNFMALYNPELEAALTEYVRLNRTPEELLALKLMRVYRLGEIIWYYVDTLARTSGDLHTLSQERVRFWSDVLRAVLEDSTVPLARLEKYRIMRDRLRSDEEKQRQRGLH